MCLTSPIVGTFADRPSSAHQEKYRHTTHRSQQSSRAARIADVVMDDLGALTEQGQEPCYRSHPRADDVAMKLSFSTLACPDWTQQVIA
jgi:hypothetical protein